MASSEVFNVVLQRLRHDEPWGLRLQGGVDCREPLSVFKVRRRSAAERAGVKVGDLVLAISDVTADSLTHQKMLDLVSRQQLTLPLTLARPELDGAMVRWSGTEETLHQHPRDVRSSSPGLLAFIPLNVASTASLPRLPQLTSGCHGDDTASISSSSYKPSYWAPSHRTFSQEKTKSYQPLDMTGKNAFYSAPLNYSHLPPRQYYGGSLSSDRSDVDSVYSTQPSSTLSSPSDSAKLSRSYYYSDDVPSSSSEFSTPQSRSFLLLEAALHAQGAGVPGARPSEHAT